MTALIVFCFVLAGGLLLVACLDQRKVYWKTTAWKYRNPHANEPSDAALAFNRVGLVMLGIVMVSIAFIFMAAVGERTYSTARVRAVASETASELGRGGGSGFGPSYRATSDVHDIVQEKGSGNVNVHDAGSGKYELTNRNGDNAVCLTVGVGGGDGPWSHSISTSVDEGRC